MIELTESQAAVYGVVFTMVGALIGALSSVYAARLSAEKQHLYEQSARFIKEFVSEIILLRKAADDAYKIIGSSNIDRHKKAKVLFEPWVKKKELKSFHKAWDEYEHGIKTIAPGSLDNRKNECNDALKQIEKLLSYARTKG